MKSPRILPVLTLAAVAVAVGSTAAFTHAPAGLVRQLADPDRAEAAVESLAAHGDRFLPALIETARTSPDMTSRGWAVLALGNIPGRGADEALRGLHAEGSLPALVRTWAAAARIRRSRGVEELLALAPLLSQLPALDRPFEKAVAVRIAPRKRGNTSSCR